MKLRGAALIPVARRWYDAGCIPIPLLYRSKKPSIYWRAWQTERPAWSEICQSFATRLYRGIGVLTGAPSNNLVVLDFDTVLAYARWKAATGGLDTYTVCTGRGFHVYVRLTHPPLHTLSMEGGEVKASGYVVAPPSTHPSGAEYRQYTSTTSVVEARNLSAIGISPIVVEKPRREAHSSSREPSSGRGLIDEIKRTYPLTTFLSLHTELWPSDNEGRFLMAVCPFHNDHNPSLWVNTELQICGCFSPHCPAHGRAVDVINAYGLLTGIQNGEAVFDLARQLGLI